MDKRDGRDEKPERQPALIRLADAGLTVEDPRDDVRGRRVFDREGEHIGDVDGLLVDEEEKKVRFLEIGSGGFLGIGQTKRLVPVDAVARVEEGAVHVDRSRDDVVGGPVYDPEVVVDAGYYGGVYGHYGYTPYWMPGYIYPYGPYP